MTDFNQLKALEKASRILEPDSKQTDLMFSETQAFSKRFIEQLDTIKAFDDDFDKTDGIEHINLQDPITFPEAIQELENKVFKGGLEPASGGHIGYIPGGGILPSALGDTIAAVTNKYAGMFFGSPGAVRLENKLVRWFCNRIGYANTSNGVLLSGGSLANLTGIIAGRDAKEALRMGDAGVIYMTKQTHHCMDKAIRISGLAYQHVRYIPMDKRFRMDPVELQKQITQDKAAGLQPWLLIANAGSTDTGAIDPLDTLADISEKENLWFHVDGAYGGLFCLLDELDSKFAPLKRADSLVLDPHKTLFLPYGLGVALVKNGQHLKNSFGFSASYMQDAQNQGFDTSPAEIGPELTKHFRGLRLWLPLRIYGLAPFVAGLREKIMLTQYFREEINQRGFETPYDPELTVLLFRMVKGYLEESNAYNSALQKALQADGRIFISSTNVDGVFYLRIAVLSFRTHKSTMDVLLEMIDAAVEGLG